MHPLISLFKENAETLKLFLTKEIEALHVRDVGFLVESFPQKMDLYTHMEAIGSSIKNSFSAFSEQEQLFLQDTAQELDQLAEDSAMLLKGNMLATQKMLDIIVFASQTSQNPLKVYDRQAKLEDNSPFSYSKR